MSIQTMRTFLTEENIMLHKNHLKHLKAIYSISEKSIDQIKGKGIREIKALNLRRGLKEELCLKLMDIRSHELYFSSFGGEGCDLRLIKKYYSSPEAFRYEILELARSHSTGFIYVGLKHGVPVAVSSEESYGLFTSFDPLLAIDICEHAYFLDYRFEREKYLAAAVNNLNLNKLTCGS